MQRSYLGRESKAASERSSDVGFMRTRDPFLDPVEMQPAILTLQRTIGNQAVIQLLRKQSESRREATVPSPVPEVHTPASIQPKLEIGAVNSLQEREADRVAAQVMQLSPDAIPTPRSEPAESSKGNSGLAPGIVHEVLRSSGSPLDTQTREFFESRFGREFGDVRVHTDQLAVESAVSVDALAYTVGPHIVFAEGQWAPETSSGRQLISHELAHVVQQLGGTPALHRQPAKPPPKPPVADKVPGLGPARTKEVEDLIQANDRAGAVDTLVNYKAMDSEIDLNLLANKKMTYDAGVTASDATTGMPRWDYVSNPPKAEPCTVKIGPSAFSSVSYLYSVIMHEYQHVLWQQTLANQKISDLVHQQPNVEAPDEARAGSWELLHAKESGLASMPEKIAQIWKNLNETFWNLDQQGQTSERALVTRAYQKAKEYVKGTQVTLVLFSQP
jgi:hypothetical protein